MSIESSTEKAAFRQFEHQGWEDISSGYDRGAARVTQQCAPDLLDAANVGRGTEVLDVCTGTGVMAAAARERSAQVVGVDFSAECLRIAMSRAPDADFREGDAEALDFPDSSFDAVVYGFGLIHLADPQAALLEFHRVLKPGGRCAVSVWLRPDPATAFGLLLGAISSHGDMNVPLPHGPDFFQFSEAARLRAALLETGFADIETKVVELVSELEDDLGLIRSTLEGSVRARALLERQPDSAKEAIVGSVKASMSAFKSSDGLYRVPMPALVGAGSK